MKINSVTGLLAITIGLVACNDNQQSPVSQNYRLPDTQSTIINRENMVAKQVAGYSKPGAGVSIEYQLPEKIFPGQVVEFVLTLGSRPGSGELNVEVRSEGVEVINQEVTLTGNGKYSMVASVYCPEAGRHYINLFVSNSSSQGHTRRQVNSLPVQVGSLTADSKVTQKQAEIDRGGSPIRVLPAKEIISNI